MTRADRQRLHAANASIVAARERLAEAAESGTGIVAARAALVAARATAARVELEVERAHRVEQRLVCAEVAATYERGRDVPDWAERAAQYRALETEHAARIVQIDAAAHAPVRGPS